MKILFVHPNMPGQYKHLCPKMAEDPENEVVFLTKRRGVHLKNVRTVLYDPVSDAPADLHPFLKAPHNATLRGLAARDAMIQFTRETKFTPDIIVGHPGWGDMLFLKDLFLDAPMLSFFEFYYNALGSDVEFSRKGKVTLNDCARLRITNMHHLMNLHESDWGLSPTVWQRDQYPRSYHNKMTVLHDGINTDIAKPNNQAEITLASGYSFQKGDEVVTYISRNFEPYRGFPTFIFAAEKILKARPNCHIIAIGADGSSYTKPVSAKGKSYRETYLEKVDIDLKRLHFVGRVPYSQMLLTLQISAAHIYLTYPFVLSWSMLEAMACGCAMVCSDTAPVREVIKNNQNGYLIDFRDPQALAERVCDILHDQEKVIPMRSAARETILEKYALSKVLPQHVQLLKQVQQKQLPPSLDLNMT